MVRQQKERKRGGKFTVKSLRAKADWFRQFSGEVDGFVSALEASKFDGTLEVDVGESLETSIGVVSGWLAKITDAYRVDAYKRTNAGDPPSKKLSKASPD